MRKLISLIIPCYNEEAGLGILYKALTEVSAKMSEYDFEYLFINDGSKDSTLDLITEFADGDPRVKYISFSRNFGKEAAMYAGFCNAKGDYVTVMDSDMQDPPSLLPQMVEILEQGEYDSVATRRVTRAGEPPIRSFFARAFYKIINRISDANVVDGARDFRLMRREMVDTIVSMGEANRFSKGIFGWIGFKTYWLSYENVERAAGETKWSFWKLFKYAIDGMVNFSQAPLMISAWVGFFFVLVSLLAIVFVFVRKLVYGGSVEGWASLVCIMLFIAGVQLFCMGVMGSYLAKIYQESKHRPHYIVGKTNIDDVVKK
ncbi:MAG: glycosyltransferase family 2 protein [Clostridiales bacterium]|nr:glycosyltransferase family 2 protein [Clostridiales bacterium]MDY2909797.1 glycosyltransferase family 2 protein [Oscillospiraceae bacterium]